MADNTALNPGVGGDTIADEDIAGVKYQKIKLIDATVGSTAPIGTTANPLPVTAASLPLPTGGATSANQTTEIASLANLDVALSTRLKPADTLAGVTALGSITGALPTGTNIIGKVGIDQTTPGTTNAVSVTNSFLLDATFTGRINTQGQNTMALSTPVVLPSDQSAIPVTVASLPLSTNAAIETGGNLATIAATNLQIQQLLELQREQLANMKCMCYLLMQIASINLNPNEFMNEAVLQ